MARSVSVHPSVLLQTLWCSTTASMSRPLTSQVNWCGRQRKLGRDWGSWLERILGSSWTLTGPAVQGAGLQGASWEPCPGSNAEPRSSLLEGAAAWINTDSRTCLVRVVLGVMLMFSRSAGVSTVALGPYGMGFSLGPGRVGCCVGPSL